MITLTSYMCRNEFTLVTHRGVFIDSLYSCTIVVAPIEMPNNITYSYIIYRWKTFVTLSSLFLWQVQNKIFSPVNVRLVVKLFLRLDQREMTKITMNNVIYTVECSAWIHSLTLLLSLHLPFLFSQICACSSRQNANSGFISWETLFKVCHELWLLHWLGVAWLNETQLSVLCHAYSILKEMLFNLFCFRKIAVDATVKVHPLDLHFIQSHALPLEDLFITVFIFLYKKKKDGCKLISKDKARK